MNKKIALLFAGQGAQAVGMGKDLAAEFPVAADLFKQADDFLGFPPLADRLRGSSRRADQDVGLPARALCAWSGVSRRP